MLEADLGWSEGLWCRRDCGAPEQGLVEGGVGSVELLFPIFPSYLS